MNFWFILGSGVCLLVGTCIASLSVHGDVRTMTEAEMSIVTAGSCGCPENRKTIGTTCGTSTSGRCMGQSEENCAGSCNEDYCDEWLAGKYKCTGWPDHAESGCVDDAYTTDCGNKYSDGTCKWYDPDGFLKPLPKACYCAEGTKIPDGCDEFPNAAACDPTA